MLNPTAWNWSARTGFWWAGWCSLCLLWSYFRLPEPKGRTYGELDALFERRVSARKFHHTDADLLSAGHIKPHERGAAKGNKSGARNSQMTLTANALQSNMDRHKGVST